jgi:hypothetical protein
MKAAVEADALAAEERAIKGIKIGWPNGLERARAFTFTVLVVRNCSMPLTIGAIVDPSSKWDS